MERGFLKANATKRALSVPEGLIMGGYGDRTEKSQGTHDELYTKSLAISNGEETFVIITNDLLDVDAEMTAFIRLEIQQAFSIPEKNILIAATHTHSGPDLHMGTCDPEIEDEKKLKALNETLKEMIVKNAFCSLQNLTPALIGIGSSSIKGIGGNRTREDLPSDHTVQVIHLKKKSDHSPIATLVNYTCHPTILNANNYLYSADYPGILQKQLEELGFGIVLFTNGAAGNQSTRFTRQSSSFTEVERMGAMLAEESIKAIQHITVFEDKMVLKSVRERILLPLKKLPEKEEALKLFQEASLLKEKAIALNQSPADVRLAVTKWQGTYITLRMIDEEKKIRNAADIQLMQLGPIMLVGIPVELFVEYGLEIKEKTKHPHCVIVGYANDLLGYVYHDDPAYIGLYEALASPFAANAGDCIVEKVLELEIRL